jgi:hypothetical protein
MEDSRAVLFSTRVQLLRDLTEDLKKHKEEQAALKDKKVLAKSMELELKKMELIRELNHELSGDPAN